MCSVTGKCDAAKSPALDRILVDHRVLEDLVGVADHLRDVEPIEMPAFVKRKEIGQISRLVPVVLFGGVAFDLGHPVDQLVTLAIDVIDDRIDHDLAGQN